ncbi:hypothetical protein DFH07DRAFT_557799 [Mycena maculata]|uniref:Uncharacterized protein n=1 Tax=Mycena maculata TaxID=230809 RepID=A0AAD7N7V6_9AGAR|nr:hypothetical protein DFH07DRAFT_557799 [Mycena maculata]
MALTGDSVHPGCSCSSVGVGRVFFPIILRGKRPFMSSNKFPVVVCTGYRTRMARINTSLVCDTATNSVKIVRRYTRCINNHLWVLPLNLPLMSRWGRPSRPYYGSPNTTSRLEYPQNPPLHTFKPSAEPELPLRHGHSESILGLNDDFDAAAPAAESVQITAYDPTGTRKRQGIRVIRTRRRYTHSTPSQCGGVTVSQAELEGILRDRLVELGYYRKTLVGIAQDANKLTASVKLSDGRTETVEGTFLVATARKCGRDGHSVVSRGNVRYAGRHFGSETTHHHSQGWSDHPLSRFVRSSSTMRSFDSLWDLFSHLGPASTSPT